MTQQPKKPWVQTRGSAKGEICDGQTNAIEDEVTATISSASKGTKNRSVDKTMTKTSSRNHSVDNTSRPSAKGKEKNSNQKEDFC